MFFADPAGALAEFHRVLAPERVDRGKRDNDARALTVRPRGAVIGRYVPEKADQLNRIVALPERHHLDAWLRGAGFQEVCLELETRGIQFSSFDDYFGGIAKGATLSGQEYVQLPADGQLAVREEVWRTWVTRGRSTAGDRDDV